MLVSLLKIRSNTAHGTKATFRHRQDSIDNALALFVLDEGQAGKRARRNGDCGYCDGGGSPPIAYIAYAQPATGSIRF